jgi:hypothetical protein
VSGSKSKAKRKEDRAAGKPAKGSENKPEQGGATNEAKEPQIRCHNKIVMRSNVTGSMVAMDCGSTRSEKCEYCAKIHSDDQAQLILSGTQAHPVVLRKDDGTEKDKLAAKAEYKAALKEEFQRSRRPVTHYEVMCTVTLNSHGAVHVVNDFEVMDDIENGKQREPRKCYPCNTIHYADSGLSGVPINIDAYGYELQAIENIYFSEICHEVLKSANKRLGIKGGIPMAQATEDQKRLAVHRHYLFMISLADLRRLGLKRILRRMGKAKAARWLKNAEAKGMNVAVITRNGETAVKEALTEAAKVSKGVKIELRVPTYDGKVMSLSDSREPNGTVQTEMTHYLKLGPNIDIRLIKPVGTTSDPQEAEKRLGQRRRVAFYISKYLTKDTGVYGLTEPSKLQYVHAFRLAKAAEQYLAKRLQKDLDSLWTENTRRRVNFETLDRFHHLFMEAWTECPTNPTPRGLQDHRRHSLIVASKPWKRYVGTSKIEQFELACLRELQHEISRLSLVGTKDRMDEALQAIWTARYGSVEPYESKEGFQNPVRRIRRRYEEQARRGGYNGHRFTKNKAWTPLTLGDLKKRRQDYATQQVRFLAPEAAEEPVKVVKYYSRSTGEELVEYSRVPYYVRPKTEDEAAKLESDYRRYRSGLDHAILDGVVAVEIKPELVNTR